MSSLYAHLTQCAKLISKHHVANFKHLLEMELATVAIFLVVLSVNNGLFIYVFAISIGCEIIYLGTAELKSFPYISARVTCTIN